MSGKRTRGRICEAVLFCGSANWGNAICQHHSASLIGLICCTSFMLRKTVRRTVPIRAKVTGMDRNVEYYRGSHPGAHGARLV